jgi:hypothetical protein
MYRTPRALVSMCFGVAVLATACVEDEGMPMPDEGMLDGGTEDGDDQPAEAGDGDGDGDADTGQAVCDVPSPYMGGWDIGCCQDELEPSPWYAGGVGQGSILPDWTFTDQFGEAVRVWDFCHDAIYFEYSAVWCGACVESAPYIAGLYNTYKDRGLMTLTYMAENVDGGPASQADATAWAENFGHEGLVVYSSDDNVWFPFAEDAGDGSYTIALPGMMLVGTGAKIAKLGEPSIQEIELVIPGE